MNEIAVTIASAVEEQGAATQEIARNVQQAAMGTQEVSSNIAGVTKSASETGPASAHGRSIPPGEGARRVAGSAREVPIWRPGAKVAAVAKSVRSGPMRLTALRHTSR